ncbi:MAG: hypothetical protein KAH48_05070, partial [Chlorobi bacterium]|nr:hypothetical protein [Chlorobiota bacterium]
MNIQKLKIKPLFKYIFTIAMMFSHLGFTRSIDSDPVGIADAYYLGFIYILIIYPINELLHFKKIIKSFEIQAVVNIVVLMVVMLYFEDVITMRSVSGALTGLLFLVFGQGLV